MHIPDLRDLIRQSRRGNVEPGTPEPTARSAPQSSGHRACQFTRDDRQLSTLLNFVDMLYDVVGPLLHPSTTSPFAAFDVATGTSEPSGLGLALHYARDGVQVSLEKGVRLGEVANPCRAVPHVRS